MLEGEEEEEEEERDMEILENSYDLVKVVSARVKGIESEIRRFCVYINN